MVHSRNHFQGVTPDRRIFFLLHYMYRIVWRMHDKSTILQLDTVVILTRYLLLMHCMPMIFISFSLVTQVEHLTGSNTSRTSNRPKYTIQLPSFVWPCRAILLSLINLTPTIPTITLPFFILLWRRVLLRLIATLALALGTLSSFCWAQGRPTFLGLVSCYHFSAITMDPS
jgi:hypothetical protein